MRQAFLKTLKGEITGKRIAAKEGMQTQGGIYKYPVNINYMGTIYIKIYKDIVKNTFEK